MRRSREALAVLVAAAACRAAAGAPPAASDVWKPAGVLRGGPAVSVAASPSGTVTVGGAGGESYAQAEPSGPWSRSDLPPIRQVAGFGDGRVLAATPGGILRSNDGGTTWDRTAFADRVESLAIRPGGTIFAATAAGLQVSTDGGSSWERTSLAVPVRAVALSSSGNILYAATSDSVLRSTDGARSWVVTRQGLPAGGARALVVTGRGHVYAATAAGLFRSIDDGNTWREIPAGSPSPDVLALVLSPSDAILAGTAAAGLLRSADGSAWTAADGTGPGPVVSVAAASPTRVLAVVGTRVVESKDGGIHFSDLPLGWSAGEARALAVGPRAALVGTKRNGLFRSTDGGATWSLVDGGWGAAPIAALAACADGTYAVGAGAAGVFLSIDDGSTWRRAALGVPGEARTIACPSGGAPLTVGAEGGVCAVAPGGTSCDPLPGWPATGVRSLTRGPDGTLVAVLEDGGLRVERATVALPDPGRRVTLGPGGELLVGTPSGILRSVDGGTTWSQTLAATFAPTGFAVLPSGEILASFPGGVSRSKDRGETWERASSGLTDAYVTSLAVDPAGVPWVATMSGAVFRGTAVSAPRPAPAAKAP